MVSRAESIITLLMLTFLFDPIANGQGTEADYYPIVSISTPRAVSDSRDPNWKPAPEGLPLEVSGMAALDDGRLAVAIRKGEIWLLDGVDESPPKNVTYKRFATALHEPLGLLRHDGAFYTVQRGELTRLEDRDGDGRCDAYRAVASPWGLTGHYHEYAYGPELDRNGNFVVTLNIGLGLKGEQLERTLRHPTLGYRQARWRGWSLTITPDGTTTPQAAGMRSPAGLGKNLAGDLFYTDQQGNWVATNALHHLRPDVFYHHPEALASAPLAGPPLANIDSIPAGVPLPTALEQLPQLVPPAVWFPYKKMGQSATDIQVDASGGAFGPFAGQLFVGEFTQAAIHRVFLEKVAGQYQGACFPFRSGFASAVLRLEQADDGSLFVGLTNRGWSSLGEAAYGLQRLTYSGRVPFEIQQMRATPEGFALRFTRPVDRRTAADPASYQMQRFTYRYHASYGSDEIQTAPLTIRAASVNQDATEVRLTVEGRRRYFVHELTAAGLRDGDGNPLLHDRASYTLNAIPTPTPLSRSRSAPRR